ncbi:MAG: hypothetical protein EBZ81_15600 [Betaproteobacteria bacterium]|nr:hypothetical protein [Betaproteobacteria bacterium]
MPVHRVGVALAATVNVLPAILGVLGRAVLANLNHRANGSVHRVKDQRWPDLSGIELGAWCVLIEPIGVML